MTNQAFTETTFSEFNLNSRLIDALTKAGFTHCTPIQAQCIPYILENRDVAGQAQTGTGKTLAFLIGIFQRLLESEKTGDDKDIRAIIMAPTRELAIQIHADAEKINSELGIKLGLAYGGIDYEKQRKTLEDGVDILIGTPGRTIDYLKQKVFSLKNVEVTVLDEADRMFDLGFINDIRFLFSKMPIAKKRLNMLFSATLSHRVQELAYVQMNEPVHVVVEADNITADRITQSLYMPSADEKAELLIGLMRKFNPSRSVVFTNMKATAEEVHSWLEANGFSAALLSGDIPQNKRQRLLKEFKDGDKNVLVATDVAARGLHIDEVSHVFNYDLPNDAEDYVHRIGRTARAGSEGMAISFACDYSAINLPAIEEFIEQKIPKASIDDSDFATDLNKPKFRSRKAKDNKKRDGKRTDGKRADGRTNRPDRPKKEFQDQRPTRKDATSVKADRKEPESKEPTAIEPVEQYATNAKVLISRAPNEKGLKLRTSKTPGEYSMRSQKNMLTPQNASLRALHPSNLKKLDEISSKTKWDVYDSPVVG